MIFILHEVCVIYKLNLDSFGVYVYVQKLLGAKKAGQQSQRRQIYADLPDYSLAL